MTAWRTSRIGPQYRGQETRTAEAAPFEPLGEDLLARGERRRAAEFLRAHQARRRDRGWPWMWESWMTLTDRECWR
ncbi:MAG TPA: hypothetical protein VFI39_07760 [Gemmatimonadales bacterium]|nr:hypothetical protein [Gemmatimonadales bacterium]